MSVGSNPKFKRVGLGLKRGNQAGNFFIPSGETKDNCKEDKESEGRQDHHPPQESKCWRGF